MDWKNSRIDALLEQALVEDQAVSDSTTIVTIDPELKATASITAREELVVAGLGAVPRFLEIFARLDRRPQAQTRFEVVSHPEIFDGVRAHKGQVLAVIRHNARVLLSCERVILNLLQHMSGVATLTRLRGCDPGNDGARAGHAQDGAGPARAGEVRGAVRRGHQSPARSCVRNSDQEQSHRAGRRADRGHHTRLEATHGPARPGGSAQPAGTGRGARDGAEAILLDNMTVKEVKDAVERIRKETEGQKERWIPTEASGGIVLENIRAYAETGVDFISVGALTHSAKAADISMSITAE